MKKVIAVVAIVSLVAFGSVAADDSSERQSKSPGTATLISFLGTAIPVAVGVAIMSSSSSSYGSSNGAAPIVGFALTSGGYLIGPGLGHLYAHNTGRFVVGLGLRMVGAGALLAAFAMSFSSGADSGGEIAVVGSILGGSITLIDILSAGNSARKYNEKHGLANVSISPSYFASQKAFGVQLTIGL